jgi:hypothetical protein
MKKLNFTVAKVRAYKRVADNIAYRLVVARFQGEETGGSLRMLTLLPTVRREHINMYFTGSLESTLSTLD